MNIIEATEQWRNEIIRLLQSQKLPTEDLPLPLANFYIALEADKVIGVIGMEQYGSYGLLRSMVVHPDYRNQQIAERLVQLLEERAVTAGITSLFLLTETAEKYFTKKRYTIIARNEVPSDLLSSSEFSHVCPVSATVMKKDLVRPPLPIS